ncbi:uncharacterized protein LOC113521874 [Galleria mellonella]|uniref:Uncharacterized protein LOC113521874 n=1 Tax=Galleria mellonella TaxID=7137 RepID=A0A6J1X1S7_GALME|nr:uncharacterized protein LOC113521874 [Galleria mellonella]
MDATLQRIITTLKHFERKLDKLQDAVSYHGQTLSELRFMVTSLSNTGDKIFQNGKLEDYKYPMNKTTAMQYDERVHIEEPVKMKRKAAIQPLQSKTKAKIFPSEKYGFRSSSLDESFLNKLPLNTNDLGKHTGKLEKVDARRKATMLRTQKEIDKKRSKI